MATAQAFAETRLALRELADYGATFAELLDNLDEQNRRLGRADLSDGQEEELQLYCWALRKGQSSGALSGPARVWGGLEDDIGG
jgi:hypothetical protein